MFRIVYHNIKNIKQSYANDDNESNDSDKELNRTAVRSVYLVTYSQADMTVFLIFEVSK